MKFDTIKEKVREKSAMRKKNEKGKELMTSNQAGQEKNVPLQSVKQR